MVGMDSPVNLGKPKERDCLCALSLKQDEELQSQPHESEIPGALIGYGTCNGKIAALSPITPNPCSEKWDVVSMTSSLSSESPKSTDVDGSNSSESDEVVGSGQDSSPRTPKHSVFDPFAPGPEEMLLAPMGKKIVKKSEKVVARRLSFDDDDSDDDVGDDSLNSGEDVKELEILYEKTVLDAVCGTLFEAILLEQTEDFLAENNSSGSESPVGTPTSLLPSLTEIAESCPQAPMKAISGKSRNIDPGLCRKLEF